MPSSRHLSGRMMTLLMMMRCVTLLWEMMEWPFWPPAAKSRSSPVTSMHRDGLGFIFLMEVTRIGCVASSVLVW